MLIIDRDSVTGETYYMVCNDQGLCLIRTRSSAIADFIERRVQGIPPTLRLTVGGDPGTKSERKLWQHVRRWKRHTGS
jgi:hypothetical protein